jgi:putative ABC transport system permease protein
MFEFSLHTFRERWQLFIGSILTVAVGVGLMQASLQVLIATSDPPIPPTLSTFEAAQLREAYDGASTLMGLAMLLAVFLAIFIVGSTFAFTVAQRRRDLALLRLVGGSRAQLRRLLLSEASLLGLCGGVIGIPLGLLLLQIQLWLLIDLQLLPEEFTVSPIAGVIVGTSLVGVGISLLGVLAASRRAAKVRPLEALRDTGAARQVMTPSRWFFGLVMTACAVGLTLLAQTVGSVIALVIALGFTMAGAIALSLLSPLVVPLASRLCGLAMRWSILGRIAEENLREGVRRSASTAAPLIVLVALTLGIAGALSSLTKAAAQEQLTRTLGSLIVRSSGADAARISSVPGVAVASPQVSVPMILTMTVANRESGDLTQERVHSGIVAVDPALYQRTHRTSLEAGSIDDLSGPAIVATVRSEERMDLGATITADLGDGAAVPLRLVGVMPERLSTSEAFLVPLSAIPEQIVAGSPAVTVVQVNPGTDPAAVADAVRAAGIGEVSMLDEWVAAEAAEREADDVGIMVVLLGLSGLYAALAVVNSVVIAYTARRREFATARVTGLTRRQVIQMAVLESCAVTFTGLLLGGVVVAGTLAAIGAGTGAALGSPVVAVPLAPASIMVIGAFVVTGLTTVLTTLSATRQRPVTLLAASE